MRRVADPPGTPVRGFRFGRVAAFKSEPWPASFRNGGRHQIGMPGRNASEFASPGAMCTGDKPAQRQLTPRPPLSRAPGVILLPYPARQQPLVRYFRLGKGGGKPGPIGDAPVALAEASPCYINCMTPTLPAALVRRGSRPQAGSAVFSSPSARCAAQARQ